MSLTDLKGKLNKIFKAVFKLFMSKKQITLKKLILSKEDVSRMEPGQLRHYFIITNILHDLDFYGKLLIFIVNSPAPSRVENYGKAVSQIFILIKYISSIYEMFKFLKKDVIGKVDERSDLKAEANKIIMGYKSNYEEIYCFIRNKYGFHYEWQKDLEPFICEAVKEYGELDIYLSDILSGNDVFASSSAVVFMTIINKMKKHGYHNKNTKEIFEDLRNSTINIGEQLRKFYRRYLVEVVLKSVKFVDTGEVIEVPAKKFSECQLSFFVVSG